MQSDKVEVGYGGVRLKGAITVDLFGNPDKLSEIEKKLLEEDKRRRQHSAEIMQRFGKKS